MIVNLNFFLSTNPFIDAYLYSDLLGKLIFIGLILLSIISWVIIIYKFWYGYKAKKFSYQFQSLFQTKKHAPLSVDYPVAKSHQPNPFYELYLILKKQSLDILNKNKQFSQEGSYLSQSDIDYVNTHLISTIAMQKKELDKNLFILSTIVSLGPFLGLLGTVWGILTTFSELQVHNGVGNSQMVLGGLSLALATTVLGLIDAIPALIGYNYLKNGVQNFQVEMEGFATEILASLEMQYRKVEI